MYRLKELPLNSLFSREHSDFRLALCPDSLRREGARRVIDAVPLRNFLPGFRQDGRVNSAPCRQEPLRLYTHAGRTSKARFDIEKLSGQGAIAYQR
jgi:hypothetical protein